MKNVMIVHTSLVPGGAEKMITYLANLLSNKYNVYFVMLEDKEQFFKLNKYIKIIQLNYNMSIPVREVGYLASAMVFINVIKDLVNLIKRYDIDLIIAFKDRESLFSWIATKVLNKKLLLSHRGDPYEKTFIWKYLLRLIYNSCDDVVFQLDTVKKYYQVKGDKTTVIPNPAKRLNVSRICDNNCYNLLSAGRFQDIKRFDILIKSFAKVQEQFPRYKLYIYGDGEERGRLQDLILELGLENNVFLPGMVKNVIENNINSRMFIFTSKTEGMPNILIEALAAGIPCIATKCSPGGAEFLLNYGENGILVDVDDVDGISNAIITYINNWELAEMYGRKGQEFTKKLDIKRINKMWLDVVDRII